MRYYIYVQFETIVQPLFWNRSYLYKSTVKYLGVPKHYHERQHTNFLRYFEFFKVKKSFFLDANIYLYKKKKQDTRTLYISRENIEWIFQDKYSLKIGASVSSFKINISPKVSDDLRSFLEPSTSLINKESGQEEFDSVPTEWHFFSRRKGIEEAVEKLNRIKNWFLYKQKLFSIW